MILSTEHTGDLSCHGMHRDQPISDLTMNLNLMSPWGDLLSQQDPQWFTY